MMVVVGRAASSGSMVPRSIASDRRPDLRHRWDFSDGSDRDPGLLDL